MGINLAGADNHKGHGEKKTAGQIASQQKQKCSGNHS